MDPGLLLLIGLGWLMLAVVTAAVWLWPEDGFSWRRPARDWQVPGWPEVTRERIRELRGMPYDEYLRTPEWTQRSMAVKKQAGWVCTQCGSRDRVQTHHLTYRRRGNERPSDLQVLCDACHRGVHATTSSPERPHVWSD